MTKSICKLFVGLLLVASPSLMAKEQATVRLKMVDEAGKAVPNAGCWVIFDSVLRDGDLEVETKTKADGTLQIKGWPIEETLSSVHVISQVPGYYTSRVEASARGVLREFDLTLTLRKRGKPTAMYAKEVELELPEQRKEIGFDMKKGDWVKPYGEGEVADFMFLGQKNFEDSENFETSVIMSFPGEQEGMQLDPAQKNKAFQLSNFKTSRTAPLEGYQHTRKFVRKRAAASREGSTKEANCLFRSRVVLDEAGKIKSCHYGKMLDAVNVVRKSGIPEGNPIVVFTYYFNPTPNDRNLEFDPEQNLFPSPDGNLQVAVP